METGVETRMGRDTVSLIDNTLFGVVDKVAIAIARMREFEPLEGYYLAFSGGKDSQCIYHLAVEAGVKFDAHFSFTTVDPPELLRFIRDNYPDVIWHKPKKTMWQLIVEKGMPPSRQIRYCCQYLKEDGGKNRVVLLGVRREESIKRSKRMLVENCQRLRKTLVSPIVDWKSEDVWEYIKIRNIKYCSLYNEGHTRIGCVGCPLQTVGGMRDDFSHYPNYYKAYMRAFGKMIEERNYKQKKTDLWKTPEDVMKWFMGRPKHKENPDQTVMFE